MGEGGSSTSRGDVHFAEAGQEVFLGAVAFDAVAVGAEELEVVDVVGSAAGLGDDVVDFQDAEGDAARECYGVVVAPYEQQVDATATEAQRRWTPRRLRRRQVVPPLQLIPNRRGSTGVD